jgi:hypothetical protein
LGLQIFSAMHVPASYYPYIAVGVVIFLYVWRIMSVHTYNFLLQQREYELQHSIPAVGDDSSLEYIQYDRFDGPRKGFVYRYGSKGVGYYEDRPPATNNESKQCGDTMVREV